MEITSLLLMLGAALCTSVSSSRFREFHIGEKRVTWTEAQQYCRERYTDLVTVYSQEENDQLYQKLQPYGDPGWIGLRHASESDKWSDGDTSIFTKWLNAGGKQPPYCAAMTPNGTWETLDCSLQRNFMCYNNEFTDPSLRHTLVKEQRSWYDAQRYCRVNHTDLVSINNQSHNEAVKERGKESSAPFWIGMIHDNWAWSDQACSTYRNWYTGQAKNKEHDKCTKIEFSFVGLWTSVNCDAENHPLCYKEQIHLITETKTWEEVQDYCRSNYRSGLRIESEQDQHAVQQVLNNRNISGYVWLGLRQSRLFGFWIWANGVTVGWSNWEVGGQPEQPQSHICGAMATREGGFKWSDQNCLSKFSFLCEGEPHTIT